MAIDSVSFFSPVVPSRRSFLRSAGGAAASAGLFGGAPLLLLSRKASAQASGPNDVGNVAYCARNAYIQAGGSDASAGFTGIGYRNKAVFSQIAAELQYLQNHMNDYGIAPQANQAAAMVTEPIDRFNPNFGLYACNKAGFMPTVPNDFFSLVPMGLIESDMGVTLQPVGPINVSATINQVVPILQEYGAGDYAAIPSRRLGVHIENAYFRRGGSTASYAILAAAGGTLATVGLNMINSAGIGVLTGTLSAGVAGAALAWTGVGLLVIGIVIVGYVAYRMYTQINEPQATPWTRPTDQPSNWWAARWTGSGSGGSAPVTQPDVYSSICYVSITC